MSFREVVARFFIINLSYSILALEGSENNSLHYVTSSEIRKSRDEIHRELDRGSLKFKITVEPLTEYELCIGRRNVNVLNNETKFKVFGDEEIVQLKKGDVRKIEGILVEGFVLLNSGSSFIIGYIRNTQFYGTVDVLGHVYSILRIETNSEIFSEYKNTSLNAIAYKTKKTNEEPKESSNQNIIPRNDSDFYTSIIGNGNVCSLFVLIDNSFLKILHRNALESAVAQVLNTIDEANVIFRSTDFDGDGVPDNIGFYIKHLIVLKSDKTPLNILPAFSWQPLNGRIYTMKFSQYAILNEVCLGIAFTAQPFQNHILGLSYTAEIDNEKTFRVSVGGICDKMLKRRPLSNFNALVISGTFQNGAAVPQYLLELSLAHELGHSFGSLHDRTEDCSGYLMASNAPKKLNRQSYLFSSCSKRAIVKTVLKKSHCFEVDEQSFCGNGKIEKGEICDCGTVRDCAEFDGCCVPRGRSGECNVNYVIGHECHPSEGFCCSDKCHIRDLSEYNMDCRTFQQTCPCQNNSTDCSCGVNGKCTNNICSSEECTRVNLEECVCPAQNDILNCQICCLLNNTCLSSIEATEYVIKVNPGLITDRHKETEEVTNLNFGFNKEFCQGSECLNFFFRNVTVDEYCLQFGKVGICKLGGRCVVRKIKHIYPTLRSFPFTEKKNTAKNNISTKTYIYVISIFFYLFL